MIDVGIGQQRRGDRRKATLPFRLHRRPSEDLLAQDVAVLWVPHDLGALIVQEGLDLRALIGDLDLERAGHRLSPRSESTLYDWPSVAGAVHQGDRLCAPAPGSA